MMEERGVEVDHSTINRWVVKYVPLLDQQFRADKRPVGSGWRLDETYVKVKGSWKYLYRAVDKSGATVDFLLTADIVEKVAFNQKRKLSKPHMLRSKKVLGPYLTPAQPIERLPQLQREGKLSWSWQTRSHRGFLNALRFSTFSTISAKRDRKAALRFLRKAIGYHGAPKKITIDKSGANKAAIESYNAKHEAGIEIRQNKYLNNGVEQDQRAVKRVARPMLGFKSFRSAAATLAGIELMHMIRKGQLRAGQIVSSSAFLFAGSVNHFLIATGSPLLRIFATEPEFITVQPRKT